MLNTKPIKYYQETSFKVLYFKDWILTKDIALRNATILKKVMEERKIDQMHRDFIPEGLIVDPETIEDTKENLMQNLIPSQEYLGWTILYFSGRRYLAVSKILFKVLSWFKKGTRLKINISYKEYEGESYKTRSPFITIRDEESTALFIGSVMEQIEEKGDHDE